MRVDVTVSAALITLFVPIVATLPASELIVPETVAPPLLLIAIFDSVRDGGMSLLVIVHEYDTPEFIVMLPFASQSPLNEAV